MPFVLAQGSTLSRLSGSVYAPIDGAVSIDGFNPTRSDIDVTTLVDEWTRFAPGLKDGGALSINLQVDLANDHDDLYASYEAGTMESWRWTIDTVNIDFDGYINSFPLEGVEVNGKVMSNVGIKIDGAITVE